MVSLAPFPANSRDYIEAMIDEIGVPVSFVVASVSGCYACGYDPITDASTDYSCTVCSGLYWIETLSGTTYNAHVTWKYSEGLDWQTGGINMLGDCKVKVMHSDAREAVVRTAKYAVVDGRHMNIEKITLLGKPTVNRIIVDLKEGNEEDG